MSEIQAVLDGLQIGAGECVMVVGIDGQLLGLAGEPDGSITQSLEGMARENDATWDFSNFGQLSMTGPEGMMHAIALGDGERCPVLFWMATGQPTEPSEVERVAEALRMVFDRIGGRSGLAGHP